MWGKLSHNLEPLTKSMSSKVKFKYTDDEQRVFDKMKLAVACNISLAYKFLIVNCYI